MGKALYLYGLQKNYTADFHLKKCIIILSAGTNSLNNSVSAVLLTLMSFCGNKINVLLNYRSVNAVLTTETKMDKCFIEKTNLKCLCSSSKIINEGIVLIKALRKTNTRQEGGGIFTIPSSLFQTWRLKKALGTFLQSAGS